MFKHRTPRPMEEDAFARVVRRAIENARMYVETDIAPKRRQADLYYQGYTKVPDIQGRSQIVVTRVRDAVKSVVPSLARVFTQSDTIAEFTSEVEADEKTCLDQTLFVNQVFHKFGGYSALVQASTDALKARVGVVKVSLEQKPVAVHTFEDFVTPEQLRLLETDETQLITEITPPMPAPVDGPLPDEMQGQPQPQAGMIPPMPGNVPATMDAAQPPPMGQGEAAQDVVYGVVLTKQSFRTRWHLDPVAPESVFVNRGATCVDDARIIGIAENYEAWEAIQILGLTEEDLEDADRDPTLDIEAHERTGVNQLPDDDGGDPMARDILVCEAWMRIDADGDGVAELRHIVTVGTGYKIVIDEPCNHVPLAVFRADLQPHTFFPICIAEDLQQDQDAQTALLRSILNNAAQVNSPRTVVVEENVSMDDVTNPDIGAVIRAKMPGQIEELATQFVAGQTLPVLQYMESVAEARSGVTKMSQGLSADALQSSPKEAAAAIVQGSDARIELMARNLAETGVKELFIAILRTAMHEMRGPQSIRTLTGYTEVRPDLWHDQVAVNVNVGMGNGRVGEKAAILSEIAQVQQQLVSTLGLDNPLGGWEQLRKALVDKARLGGIRNAQDYLPVVPDHVIKQLSAQMQQAAQAAPPPDAGLVEAEKIKAQAQMQIKSAEIQQRGQVEQAKLETQLASEMLRARMDDDRERDIAAGRFAVDAQKVALDAAQRAEVAAQQAAPRGMPVQPAPSAPAGASSGPINPGVVQ